MDLAAFRALRSPSGQQALAAAMEIKPRESDFLSHFSQLSRAYPPALARSALETAILRQEAVSKFPLAERMYFTRPALEQATAHHISAYRARRYRGYELLLDLGCSIGGDTLALAAVAPTVGVDLDELRLAMAQANLEALGLIGAASLLRADLTCSLPLVFPHPQTTACFFDPARRMVGKRIYSIHSYQPPLSVMDQWLMACPAFGAKISPGVNLEELRSYTAEIEFISLHGELKEAVLWFGPLQTAERRATLLPGEYTLSGSLDVTVRRLPLSQPRQFLYEPDPAVIRAGLVQSLGEQLDAAQLDPDIAYLTADRFIATPFARAWHIEAWLPFQLKRLRQVLRQRGVTRVIVKKRGSPMQPEALQRALRLPAKSASPVVEQVLFLTHLRGEPIVLLCQPHLGSPDR